MKKIIILIMFFIAIFSLTACGNNQNKSQNNQPGSRPDFGQPADQPDIFGIVKSVIGNEVTIIKIERSQNRPDQIEGQDEEAQERPSGMGFGGGAGMIHRSGGSDENSRVEMMKNLREMSTGEEKVIIPVGIRMLKTERSDQDEPTAEEASLADVTADKMITVWLDKNITDRQLASFVLINSSNLN